MSEELSQVLVVRTMMTDRAGGVYEAETLVKEFTTYEALGAAIAASLKEAVEEQVELDRWRNEEAATARYEGIACGNYR